MKELFNRGKVMLEAKLDGMIKPDDKEDLNQLLKVKHGLITGESYVAWYKNKYSNRLNK